MTCVPTEVLNLHITSSSTFLFKISKFRCSACSLQNAPEMGIPGFIVSSRERNNKQFALIPQLIDLGISDHRTMCATIWLLAICILKYSCIITLSKYRIPIIICVQATAAHKSDASTNCQATIDLVGCIRRVGSYCATPYQYIAKG